MSKFVSALYFGSLMHRRYRPRRHELNYDVANLFVDVDELPSISRQSWLFGYNRLSIFSIHDRQHGPGDGTPVAKHARNLMEASQPARPVKRIFMFCYPAVFGKVFNPLTVYFGFDEAEQLAAAVYEVNNTFGQRHSYVIPLQGQVPHATAKEFYVSPFNAVQGEYRFSVEADGEHLRLNIALFEGAALKLCARFDGRKRPLSDGMLARSLASLLFQPIKIIVGIHWQAFKLYLKGLRLIPRPAHGKFETSISGKRFVIKLDPSGQVSTYRPEIHSFELRDHKP